LNLDRKEESSLSRSIHCSTEILVSFILTDFMEERRNLLEVVGPDLQSHYDHLGLEVSPVVC
jgi:hypothetical protein